MQLSRHLDPPDALAEVLFGLIMVLTFTLAAGLVADEGASGVRALLAATLGCNLAWGIIDAAMYLMGCAMERGRKVRFVRAVQDAPDLNTRRRLVSNEIGDLLDQHASPVERDAFETAILGMASHARPGPLRLTRADWLGARDSFVLVFGSTLPAAAPFLIIREDPLLALRVSNHLLCGMLFAVGFTWARHAGLRPWKAGLLFFAGSLALVQLAIRFGG